MSGLRRLAAGIAAALLIAAPAAADRVADLAVVEKVYRDALAAERAAKAEADTALAAVAKARADAQAAAQAQERGGQEAVAQAKRDLLALLDERAESQMKVAEAADRARAARRIYDDARPIYEVRGRTERLADIPEWKAIEKHASDTSAEFQRLSREEQPRQQAIDRRIDAKAAEIRRLADAAVTLAPADPTGAWLAAAARADLARQAHAQAQAALVRAFDGYAARLGTTRPPFLEAVSASVANRPLYDGVWRRDNAVEDANEARRRDIRATLDVLSRSILERETEREQGRQDRLEIAVPLNGLSIIIADAEKRANDANYDKILYTAIAEAAGTFIEAVVTGGFSVAVKAAEQAAESAVEKAVARRLGQSAIAVENQATARMQRLARQSAQALSEDGARLTIQLEEIAVAAATRRVRVTGEVLDVATVDARRQVQQALRSLRSTDPVVREEAIRQAQAVFGVSVVEPLKAVLIAGESKVGGNLAAGALVAGGSTASDVVNVMLGDTIEQVIARGTSYAIAVAPSAGGAGIDAVRAAALANASKWQAIKGGSVAFLRGGMKFKDFTEAFGGTMKGNLVSGATTVVKAAITAHFAEQQYYWATYAAEHTFKWEAEFAILQKKLEGDAVLAAQIHEARELQAELRTYLALLEGPRKLVPTDGETDVAPDATIELRLRFSTEVATPTATLGGVALTLQPSGGPATASALWTASLPRRSLAADAASAQLTVSLAATAEMPLDTDPATPARPDPRVPIRAEGGRATVAWLQLEGGSDSHHTLLLRDPWNGLWARGQSRIRIERTGGALSGRLEVAGEPGHCQRGFEAGAVVLRGMITGPRQAEVELLARYERDWQQRCSDSAPGYWAKGAYTLDAVAGRLSGTWEDRQLDESCKVAETVQQRDTLDRVGAAR